MGLAKKYDAFLASESLIKQIPRLLGPGLNKAGKFPSLLTHGDNFDEKIKDLQYHQISNEEGFVLERCHRKPRRSAGAKHSLGYQFLGLSPKEALAERPLSVHQEHHGSCSTPLLN